LIEKYFPLERIIRENRENQLSFKFSKHFLQDSSKKSQVHIHQIWTGIFNFWWLFHNNKKILLIRFRICYQFLRIHKKLIVTSQSPKQKAIIIFIQKNGFIHTIHSHNSAEMLSRDGFNKGLKKNPYFVTIIF
jgi:hypothetical protein